MSRTIGAVRDNAPYVYLTKETANSTHKFVVFMLVSVAAGKKAVFSNTIDYTSGVASINVTVENETGAPAAKHPHKLTLDYTNDTNFNPATYAVVVTVSHTDNNITVRHNAKCFLEDAIDIDPTAGSAEKTAYECPYLYLTNPNNDAGGPGTYFNPACLVPLASFDKLSQHYTETDGECEQTINLDGGPLPRDTTEVSPSWIEANNKFYDDPTPVDKSFTVTVVHTTTNTRKKGRIRNVSSDTNPTTFIDTNPFN